MDQEIKLVSFALCDCFDCECVWKVMCICDCCKDKCLEYYRGMK